MELTSKVVTSDDVVSREVGGEFILLDLTSGTYFGLNEVGSRIWQLCDEKACTLAEICDQIESEFGADREEVARDILALATDLVERNLLSLEDQ